VPERRSPYAASFPALMDGLHPRLRSYFGAIPQGHSGRGLGTFTVVGTPRRWLWPILRVLARQGVLFPAWEHGVAFTVVNRPILDGNGCVAVAAVRTFELDGEGRQMIDAITAEPSGLVDHLGARRRYRVRLTAEVIEGALRLRSAGMAIRVGRRHLRLPTALSPRVSLIERYDDATDRQNVSVVLRAPLIGRVYEYAGSFEYEILPDEEAAP
jgi:hypothetical protein